jgi:hypothetical protein
MRNWNLAALALLLLLVSVTLAGGELSAPRRVAGFGDDLPASAAWRSFLPEEWASLDFARPHETSWQGVPRLVALLPSLRVDVVVLAWGSQDVQTPGWTVERSLAAFAQGVAAVQGRGLSAVMVVPPPLFEEGGLPHPVYNERLARLRSGLRELGERRGAALVDLFAGHWIESGPEPLVASAAGARSEAQPSGVSVAGR